MKMIKDRVRATGPSFKRGLPTMLCPLLVHLCRTTGIIRRHRVIRTPELRVLSPKLVSLKDRKGSHIVPFVVGFTWESADRGRMDATNMDSWATTRVNVRHGAIELSLRPQCHQL